MAVQITLLTCTKSATNSPKKGLTAYETCLLQLDNHLLQSCEQLTFREDKYC